jgi:oligo-1,6-glucosidase
VLITVGEMPGVTTQEAALFSDPDREELDMVFQFEHMSVDHGPGGRFDVRPVSLTTLKTSLVRWQAALAGRGWNSLYWNNHDQPRVVSRFGSDDPRHRVRSAKALGTVLHMLQGTPFIYQGEELGMTNYPFQTVDGFRDIETLNYHRLATELGIESDRLLAAMQYTSRDNCRTPMQWSDGFQAGFTSGKPWIPVNPNYREINAAAQVDDPDSVFHHYRRLIELRHDLEVVRTGEFHHLVPEHDQVFAYERRGESQVLLVVANLSSEACRAGIDEGWERGKAVLSNYSDPRSPGQELRPWEATVFLREAQFTG